MTKPNPKSWFAFNFGPFKIQPSAYMVRHYQPWDTEALRNWNFEVTLKFFCLYFAVQVTLQL